LEGANKFYGTEILISEHTYKHVADEVVAREVDFVRVKGKDVAVRVYELVGLIDEPLATNVSQWLETFRQGYAAFRARDFRSAAEHFQRSLTLRPTDRASKVWIGRSEELIKAPPARDWDLTFELTDK
jgi:adenylate cyclase